ncbi:MAG TPA: hypothetical protein DCL35_07210 [Candidatus Omnitrophica bacterium]|nr:hypothetical protein [Candidatus Omnitrophota bacterium]
MAGQSKILIVDDDRVGAALLREVLLAAGRDYAIRVEHSGSQALDSLEKDVSDLILLDVVLQDIDGFEVCRRIKARPSLKDVPVILVTALEKIEEKVLGFSAGASDYIVKPINADETRMRVETHLRIKQYQDELKEVNEELKRTQAASIEAAKMSAVGSLAAGVAHEFNNILGLMKGFVQLGKDDRDPAFLQQSNVILEDLIKRGEGLVDGLLNFSRDSSFQDREVIDIREVLKNDAMLLKNKFESAGMSLETDFQDVPAVDCYQNQISQVFVNMALNAFDAMAKTAEKKLLVGVKKCLCDSEGYCSVGGAHRFKSPGDCVVISIKDTGCGIPEKMRDKIFEPFVTTKGVVGGGDSSRPGTGLGLSVAYGIIKRHEGFIFFDSKPGKGTEFFIVLPVGRG